MNILAQIFVLVVFFTSCNVQLEENISLETVVKEKLGDPTLTKTNDSFEYIIDGEVQNEGRSIHWRENPSILNLTKNEMVDLEIFYGNLYSDSLIKNIEQLKSKSFNFVLLASAIFDNRFNSDICLYDSRSALFQKDWQEKRTEQFDFSSEIFIKNISNLMILILTDSINEFNTNNFHYNKLETVDLNESELREYFLTQDSTVASAS